jgi:ABC-type sugar transport system permease subunit
MWKSRQSKAEHVSEMPTRRRVSWIRPGATGLLLFLPAGGVIAVVLLYPVVASLVESVRSRGEFVGLSNYATALSDSVFWHSFRNNLVLLLSVPLRLLLALVIAAILFRGVVGSTLFQFLMFLPFVPSIAAIGVVFIYLLNITGPFNAFLSVAIPGEARVGWLTDPHLAIWAIMGIIVWTRVGFTVLLFLARLLSVDQDLFHAAAVDGASWPRAFMHVGLPELKGTIQFVVTLSFIEVFSWSFAYVYVLTQSTYNPSNYILETYLFQKEFLARQSGLAAAVAVMLLLMAGALIVYRYRNLRDDASFGEASL